LTQPKGIAVAFMADPDELQRAMDEIAAQQSASVRSDGSSPPVNPPDIATGQQSASPQTNAPPIAATQPSAAWANNYSKLNPYAGIDFRVIARHEEPRLDPYPPPSDNSGVTVASGVDLSEHTAQELRDWGVSEDAIARLADFLKSADGKTPGLKGDAARAQLPDFNRKNPTSADGLPSYEISLSDAQAMDTGALRSITGYVQRYYDAANPTISFAQLPDAIRTAIMDVAYQNGPNLAVSAPRFWQAITTGDWMGAADEMHNWTDAQKADPNVRRTLRQREDEDLIRNGFNPVSSGR
jgi:GH24 family phage-related lysozyme (muramidase)